MSPSNINSFVGDLVQMAKAMEELPEVQAELDHARRDISSLSQTVQDRELAIISYKQEIDDLHAKVRSLEVERDDASFRVLEAEDKAHNVLDLARNMQVNLEMIALQLDPPKPEPVKEAEPQELTASGWNPNIEPLQPQPVITPAEGHPDQVDDPNLPSKLPGQSESSPISTQSESENGSKDLLTDPGPALGPYFGKRYDNQPSYLTLNEWLAGGGTTEDYHWRPIRDSGSTF